MTQPVRMVLDTNVVLSALVFGGGLAGQARRAWQDGLLVPLASRATVQKLVRVVAYPRFRLSGAEQGELLVDFLSCAATVRIPQPPPPRCPGAAMRSTNPSCTWPWQAFFRLARVTALLQDR